MSFPCNWLVLSIFASSPFGVYSQQCFGKNSKGQLGQGDTDPRGDEPNQLGNNLPPVDLGPGRIPKAITAGCTHACVLTEGGEVACFGYNNYGQLGQVKCTLSSCIVATNNFITFKEYACRT